MWYFLILILITPSYVDSISSATQSSRHKRDDESEPWKHPVLPTTIEPIQYDLYLVPRYYNNDTKLEGNVTIEVNVLSQTKTFIVHKKNLTLIDWRVRRMNGDGIRLSQHFDYPENEYFVMQTEDFVEGMVQLYFRFERNMTLATGGSKFKRSGVYSIPYVNENGVGSWLVLSDFGQSSARSVFPNFDEPRFKANFRIKIRHWFTYTALSNMPVEMYEERGASSHVTVFKLSPKMSSHQVSFAITELSVRNKTFDGKQLFVWAQPGRLANADYTLDVTPTIQNFLSGELAMPYSLEKLDQITVPGDLLNTRRYGWGLNVFTESGLLVDTTMGGVSNRYEALKLIAHSQAHNYFDNLVTCRYWHHAWLNEGLATFYGTRAVMEVDPTLLHEEFFFGLQLEEAMFADTTNFLEPLIPASDSLPLLFSSTLSIHGDKGAALLRMVEGFVGAETFKNGIRRYLSQNAYGVAETDDLWGALQQDIGDRVDITKIMMNWVKQRGLPVVKVELLPGNRINATQKQFLDDPIFPHLIQGQKWNIPLTYRKKGGTDNLVWINDTDVSVVFDIPELASDDWLEFNYDRSGYYRVNYDEGLWDRIAKQLNEDHTVFTELSRSKILSDAKALVHAGDLGYDVFLNLTRYAPMERSFTPWLHIYRGLTEINNIYNTTLIRPYHNYVRSLTRNLMDELQVKDGGTFMEKQLRPLIMQMSCASGYVGCLDNTTRLFQAWIQDKTTNPVPINIRTEVYSIGVAYSVDETEWNTVYDRYMEESDADEKSTLLISLCCTRNVRLMERLLDFSVSSASVDDKVRLEIIRSIATNPYSENYVWDWLKLKYAEIDQPDGRKYTDIALLLASHNFNTRMQSEEVREFYNVHPNVSAEIKSYTTYRLEYNIGWMDRNFNTITTWLERNAAAK